MKFIAEIITIMIIITITPSTPLLVAGIAIFGFDKADRLQPVQVSGWLG